MYLVIIAWLYVVLMMALAEALSSQGSVLGAVITFVLYGLLPLGIVGYILGTPGRKRARRAREAAELAALQAAAATPGSSADADAGGHAAGGAVAAVAPERKEG